MKKKVCVVCRNEIKGEAYRVKEDSAIRFIRSIKTKLRIAQGNELFVCEKDYKKHIERRKGFEKELIIYTIIAAVVFVLLGFMPMLAGSFNIGAFLGALFVSGMILLLFVVFKYVPAIEEKKVILVSKKPKIKKKKKR